MKHVHSASSRTWLTDVLFLTILMGIFFFIGLGMRPLFVPDEGRYAEIAREMIARHDYVTPYLDSIKYFEKPPFFYWMEVAAIKVGGLNLWSVRSVNALLAIFGCLLTYGAARKLYGRGTGLLAALILATSSLYFVMAHMVSLDLPVTVFISATLYAFILGVKDPSPAIGRRYLYLAAIMAAVAVLTKGLIGIVFPGMIALAWIVVAGQWSAFKRIPFFTCIVLFLLVAAPWHLLVGQRNPEFFYFYFVEQHFLRYTNKDIGHYQPVWFFLPTLIVGFFPWIVFLPQAIVKQWPGAWKSKKTAAADIFFLLWAGIIFVFFSFSKSKLIPYILPVFPPLAIITANYLISTGQKKLSAGIKAGSLVLVAIAAVIAYTLIQYSSSANLPDPVSAHTWLTISAVILLGGALLAAYNAWRNSVNTIIATIIMALLFLTTSMSAVPAIETRTIRPLALTLKPLLKPDDTVITYNIYYQDLPFYLERKVSILNWRNELTFGMEHQPDHDWLLNNDDLWKLWGSKKRVFIVMPLDDYIIFKQDKRAKAAKVISKTSTNILISNH